MTKLKTITLKLYPKNPIWTSPDPRILQTSPPAPRSSTLLPTSFWLRVCQGYTGVLVNHFTFLSKASELVLLSSPSGSLMQGKARFSFCQRQLANRCKVWRDAERGWCVYNGMSDGSLSPKLAAASGRLALVIVTSSSSAGQNKMKGDFFFCLRIPGWFHPWISNRCHEQHFMFGRQHHWPRITYYANHISSAPARIYHWPYFKHRESKAQDMEGFSPKAGRLMHDKTKGRKQVSERWIYGESLGIYFCLT